MREGGGGRGYKKIFTRVCFFTSRPHSNKREREVGGKARLEGKREEA